VDAGGPGTDGPTIDPSLDVAARVRRAAVERADHVALIEGDERRTYVHLHRRVDGVTAALQALDVAPGDRVAVLLPTSIAFVEVALGVLRAGAVVVPLLPALADDEVRHVLVDSGAVVAVVDDDRHGSVEALTDELPDLDHLLRVDDLVAELDEDADPTLPPRAPEDLAALVYTSGTTGRPRGAMLTRGNLAANQDQSLAGRFEVGAQDVVLLVLPLAHIYAFNVGLGASLTAGATMVLVDRFDPVASLETIAEHRVSVLLGAPPMYVAWLAVEGLAEADLGSLRLAVSGAAPLPVPVIDGFRSATGLTIEEGYGLTEAGPSVSSTAMGADPRPGSVGLPLPGIELRLVDPDGVEVDRGDPGEVWVRGPNVMSGYWHDPEGSAEVLTSDGWLRTGDIATQDDDGYLYLVDRRRDLIIVSGFNVYPAEVERVLHTDPAVADAGVVGVAHPLTGETVVAAVVPVAGADVDPDALVDRCRRQLARYKCPTRVAVVDELPFTGTGKLQRARLRDQLT
jgi:long-chain acyl-CoA synthetase